VVQQPPQFPPLDCCGIHRHRRVVFDIAVVVAVDGGKFEPRILKS
jgi:hypothetical protein